MRWLLLTTLLLAACDDPLVPDPVADLKVGTLAVDDCGTLDGLDLTLDTDGVDPCGEILFVRLQAGGRPIHESNGVVVEITDLATLRDAIEADGFVEVPLPDPRIRCSLYLHARCPGSYQPLVCGGGAFLATRLDPSKRLRFQLETDVLDMRTGDVVGTGLTIDADFPVSLGSPHRPYSGCPED
ncbi:MAG: hypothetical protein ABIK09_17825 [Pseudomonadota bacterium]